MSKKIMTADQAFNVSMNLYPLLYSAPTIEEAKMKYYDQTFNVIGNGYKDMADFIRKITINKKNDMYIDGFPEKYTSAQTLYFAYTELVNSRRSSMPKFESVLQGLYTKEELENMPEVKYSMQTNDEDCLDEKDEFCPYPGFSKEYTLVWEDMSKLDQSWIHAAILFYSKCKEYFNSDSSFGYHGAHPKDDNDKSWDSLIEDFQTSFERYKTEGMTDEEYHNKITEAYESEFNGDVKQFIKDRWTKDLKEIKIFIDETLERLTSFLKVEDTPIKKPSKIKK